ncbi:MAG: protein kinase [Verrucomicrobiae bacterium]|nr:protein kinase [Verrucomicrobiae bacterium]
MSKRYEIREQIGKGGLGAVFKALDTQLQREVAIKRVLSTSNATEEEVKDAAAKLIGEAQTLSSLNHPNIVTVFDVGQDEEGGFVVMELLKGETLDETVARGVLTQEDFSEVVYQTMEALIAAQANNVIHRDIKPTNIMVIWQASGKFQLKILDFGLAKFSKSPSVQTMDQEESVMGSIFFMAPEQFERGELDARTDLYQMGCVFYNALTGQYPFNGETAPQVMNAHLQHRVIPLEQVRPDLSPSICQWVMWMINRDIDHRPKDARDALKHWPRNPEPPGVKPVEVLPVEATPEVKTGEVTVVRAARGASAPPALIVLSDKTGSAPVATAVPVDGATTGRLRTGTLNTGVTTGKLQGSSGRTGPLGQRSGAGKPNVRKTPAKEGKPLLKWIALGSVVSAIVLFAIFTAVGKANLKKKQDRIIELSSAEVPTGDTADVALAVGFLTDPDASLSLKADARKVLERLEGNGISENIHAKLKEAEDLGVRLRLAQVLAERNYPPAVPDMMEVFKSATTDDQRVQVLHAVRIVAGMKDVDVILGALHGDHTLPVRKVFEDTVLSVLRKSGDTDAVVEKILTKVSTTSGNERKSLFRILGVLGDSKVRTRLVTIYKQKDDAAYQADAIIAYLNWPDRTVLAEVEELVPTIKDAALRLAAERAFVRLTTLPGPEPVSELVPLWRRAFAMTKNPNDIRRLFGALVDYPDPETLALLKEWEKDPTHGALAKNFSATMEKAIQGIAEIKPGEDLKGNKARVRGDGGASINSFLSSITGWLSPETWFSWHFKISEPGEYFVEVDQATLRDEPSDFVVYLGGAALNGQSKRTDSLEEFETIRLPEPVKLEAGQIYSLTLAAGRTIQPRMMDIGAVRLVKP